MKEGWMVRVRGDAGMKAGLSILKNTSLTHISIYNPHSPHSFIHSLMHTRTHARTHSCTHSSGMSMCLPSWKEEWLRFIWHNPGRQVFILSSPSPPTCRERKNLSYAWKRVHSNTHREDKCVFSTSWKTHTWLGMTPMLKMYPFCEKKHLHIELLTHFHPLGKDWKTSSDRLELKLKLGSIASLRGL